MGLTTAVRSVNKKGKTVFTTYKVYRKPPDRGFVSFKTKRAAIKYYDAYGGRLEKIVTTVLLDPIHYGGAE